MLIYAIDIPPSKLLIDELTSEQKDLVDEILELYGSDTGPQLEAITHEQVPWIRARAGYDRADVCHVEIKDCDMEEYFKTLLN
ncbi:MAG: hypothetical protein LBR84_01980 [Tannerella sp.]|jgi:uncharacterized phage-associated protein|nr:hypothetical protein [Tannerella sp.]